MATVAIIEDSPTTRAMLQSIVEAAGHSVVAVAADGLEGIRMVHETRPQLVLVDMLMPMLDGIEVTRRLKTMIGAPTVVMLSSVNTGAKIQEAREAGINYYILKPFDVAQVLSVLTRCTPEPRAA